MPNAMHVVPMTPLRPKTSAPRWLHWLLAGLAVLLALFFASKAAGVL
jgi:hypothetical protein